MGLTIHYHYGTLNPSAEAAERIVRRLHALAETLGFANVTPVFYEGPGEPHTEAFGAMYPGRRVLFTAKDREGGGEDSDASVEAVPPPPPLTEEEIEAAADQLVSDWEEQDERRAMGLGSIRTIDEIREEYAAELIEVTDGGVLDLHPLELWFFWVSHPGSESLQLGLARYPAVVEHKVKGDSHAFETGLGVGWHWEGFCKTQFASLPDEGGDANFLTMHVGAIKLLDEARRLGLRPEVHDESGYWDQRDEAALLARVREWNAIVARVTGRMRDEGHGIESPIFRHPEFERLEFEGDKALAARPKRIEEEHDSKGD